MKKVVFENSLGNETMEVLGFNTIDALEKELDLLTRELEEGQTSLGYSTLT